MADLTTRQLEPGVFAIGVTGEWDLADDLGALRAWGEVLNSGAAGLLIDLEDCTFMDSSALRMLFDIHRETARRGMRWAVLGPGPAVRRLFELTGVGEQLPIVHGREAALALARPDVRRAATGG